MLRTIQAYNEFVLTNSFVVNNFEAFFYNLLAFHKQKIYQDEAEVRLLFNNDFTKLHEDRGIQDLNSKMQFCTYRELALEDCRWNKFESKDYQKIAKRIFPYVSIDSVIFGYRLSEQTKYEIMRALEPHLETYENKPNFVDSALAKYFNAPK